MKYYIGLVDVCRHGSKHWILILLWFVLVIYIVVIVFDFLPRSCSDSSAVRELYNND